MPWPERLPIRNGPEEGVRQELGLGAGNLGEKGAKAEARMRGTVYLD